MPELDERELLAEGDETIEADAIVWDGCKLFHHCLERSLTCIL